jgi:5-methylcytosine-specific restriction endonuclease McrA
MEEDKKIQKLKKYLIEIGCDLLEETSEWEIARFNAGKVLCIIYTNKEGEYNWNNGTARKILNCYSKGIRHCIRQTTKRKCNYSSYKKQLIERDGLKCFYSNVLMNEEEATIEHLIPLSRGGKNTLDNMVLCTKELNSFVGNKSIVEKIKYRDSLLNNNTKE